MAHISHEKFSWFYFVNEHWNRFLDLREPRDYYRGPFYYYVPRVLLYLVPWVGGLFYLKKLFRPASYKSLRSLILFCSCWFLALLVFFSISKAKANYYMIAGLPPLVMLIALGLGHSEAQKIPKLFKSISLVFWLVLTGAFFLLFFHPYLIPKVSAFALITFPLHFKMASLSVFVVLGIMMMCAKTRRHFLMCTGLFSTTVMVLLTYGAPEISQQYSSKDVIESLPREALEEHRVYLYKDYENISTAVFYAGHPLPIIDSHSSDLLFGQRTGTRPDLFITLEAFEKKRAQGKPLYVIVRPLFENILAGRGLCLVHKFKRHRVYATFCAL
jgi:4-amino-4-deoxy-L-arabinose transferase-like glycosyltransferase